MATTLSPLGLNSHSVSPPLNSDASQRSSICRRVTNFPGNLARWFFSSNSSTENLPLQNPCLMAPPGFAPFRSFPAEPTIHILGFLEKQDLRVVDSVSQVFRLLINADCPERCNNERFIPESLPFGVNHKQFLLNQFPNAIGGDFFEEYFGEIDTVPSIPRNFIEIAPRPGLKLVFIPEYITITVDENSPLMLDETTAVNGKKARLIEDPERAPQEQERKIKVPVTPNNFILLAQKYLKKNRWPSQFGGISEYIWPNVLDQNGDVGVGPSHWSYQKEDVIGLSKPYRSQPDGAKGQVEMANDEGLEIVPLGDRIVFHLSSYIKSGKIPQSAHFERTSTVVLSDNGHPWQSTIWWPASGPVFRLGLNDCHDYCSRYFVICNVGAATQVLAGSSQAIGH